MSVNIGVLNFHSICTVLAKLETIIFGFALVHLFQPETGQKIAKQ